MNDSPSTSMPSPLQQTQPGPWEESPLGNGGETWLASGNYQISFLPGGTGSFQHSTKDLPPIPASDPPFAVAAASSSPTNGSPALWNPASESIQEHYCGTTETLPSGSIVHRLTSEEFRPDVLGQVIHNMTSVDTVRCVRL
jgi:hypothetical protein